MFSRKIIEYNSAIPPLNKQFCQFSKKEANTYFTWYTNSIDERIEYLRDKSQQPLDFSPDSLVRLWGWFIKNARVETTPPETLEAMRRKLLEEGSPIVDYVIKDHMIRLTTQTEGILGDIGMYLGKLFLHNHSGIYWGFYTYPKEDVFVNQPLLLGFPNEVFPGRQGPPFPPDHMVRVQASRLLRGPANKWDLYWIYQKWADKLSGFCSTCSTD